jgi:ligand-binding SRPBCC domain-containing protein
VPVFEASTEFNCHPSLLFDFLVQPANLTRLSPPEANLRLVEGPDRAQMGSHITVEAKYLGVRQRMTVQIVGLEAERLLADEQVKGPFRRLRQERRLVESSGGVMLSQRVEFEPPGGLLGLVATASRIQEYLADLHEYSIRTLRSILTPEDSRA